MVDFRITYTLSKSAYPNPLIRGEFRDIIISTYSYNSQKINRVFSYQPYTTKYNYIILRPNSISRYIKHHAQYCPQTPNSKLPQYQPKKKRHRLSMSISPAVFQQDQFQHPYDSQTKPDVIDRPTPTHSGIRCGMKRKPEKLHPHQHKEKREQ